MTREQLAAGRKTTGQWAEGLADTDSVADWIESVKPTAPIPETPRNPGEPSVAEIVADEPELRTWVKPLWQQTPSQQILDLFFARGDLIDALLPGFGASIQKYSELRKHLGSYPKLQPNPVTMGQPGDAPARKIFVAKIPSAVGNLTAQGRRVSHLARMAPLRMLVLDYAEASLEGWLDVSSLSPSKLKQLAVEAIKLQVDPRCLLRGWRAATPSAPVTSGRSLLVEMRNLGLVRDASHYESLPKRNWVL